MERGGAVIKKKGKGAPIRKKRIGLLTRKEKELCVKVAFMGKGMGSY